MLEIVRDAVDLVLPSSCPGCGLAGTRLCDGCAEELGRPASEVRPVPLPIGWPGCWSAGVYEGGAARVLRAFKDGDRRDLALELGSALSRAVDLALVTDTRLARAACAGVLVLVPAPSSRRARRERGDLPVELLARRAVEGFGAHEVRVLDALELLRAGVDQAGLGGRARRANRGRSMGVRRRRTEEIAGAVVLVVDDVVTSGSTIAEAARALREAGAAHVRAATALATPRRLGEALPGRAWTD